jgi:hypothetical protein
LLNIKNTKGLTISLFKDVLTLFREGLPEGHSLPKKYYACRQYISAVGLGYDSYNACINDYIIFRVSMQMLSSALCVRLADGKQRGLYWVVKELAGWLGR